MTAPRMQVHSNPGVNTHEDTPHEDTPHEDTTAIRITNVLREKINKMADKVFIYGNRCHQRLRREVKPSQMALIEAAWEVAQRHPDEFTVAIMRRTEPRAGIGISSAHVAGGHRPR